MIAAVGRNFEIGKGNSLPWHCPADLKRFKELTEGCVVMMGKNTAISLGKPLPNRKNVVLTRHSPAERIQLVDGFSLSLRLDSAISIFSEAWVIGGAQIYSCMLPYVNEIWLSHVDIDVPGADAFFPFEEMRILGFQAVEEVVRHPGDQHSPAFKQILYKVV
ncbi:TPA: dihydrofolate reductase [Raoultella planticola]